MKVTGRYKEGIGWIYTNDLQAIKSAQDDLDSFYAQDKIDDLNNTKSAEDKILDDRIQNWQDYLDALDEQHEAYQAEVNEQLLFEQLNVTTQEELYNTMYSDMTTYIENAKLGADEYIGTFTQFLEDYKSCLEKLAELNQSATKLYSFESNNIGGNLSGVDSSDKTQNYINWSSDTNDYYQMALDSAAKGDWEGVSEALTKRGYKVNATGNDHGMSNSAIITSLANKYGEEVRGKISSSASNSNSNASSSSSGSSNSSNDSNYDKIMQDAQDYADQGKDEGWYYDENGEQRDRETNEVIGYSSGIENGAVTYTGLAMLHGSPSSPEYVLNSDQAYTLLHNLSTIKGEDYEPVGVNDITNLSFGDINLPNVEDPSNFWSELMKATSNRFNVTKNK